jgi:membrane protein implicated in regulation of membrane protease activity
MLFLAQTSSDNAAAGAAAAMLGGGFLIFWLIVLVIAVGIWYLIINKTGYSPWLSLLMLIPFVGPLIIMIMLAFTEWPIQRELRALRGQYGGGGTYAGTQTYAGGTTYTEGTPPPGAPPGSTITPS